ncbi:MAG: hemerythrin [Candidatus Eisenbacteria bacterium]|nr:hemerythrin [Candidatus Latescibacterota bacterium]MBD3300932.1 hemerythrin [Candidatus Eisenbacteria bacterium]
MKPTEILMEEHRKIEQVLEALEERARAIQGGEPIDPHWAGDALRFIREFADKCHHAKEEDQLFPMMEQRGFPAQMGPIAVMLHEHEEGRACVVAMEDAAADPQAEGASERFVRAARSYATLLRGHIMKEDQVLYPMADSAFSETDQEELAERFRKVEREQYPQERVRELHALADRVIAGAKATG